MADIQLLVVVSTAV